MTYADPDLPEPSLLPPSSRLPRRFDTPGLDAAYLVHLVERIRRNPRDLHAHVERVLLRLAHDDNAGLHAALIDLFVALGTSGRDLRSRLLAKAAPGLRSEQLALLQGHVDSGLDAGHRAAAVPGACLPHPVTGTRHIVNTRHASMVAPPSPLLLARAAIADGDEYAAQLLLEAALEQDPAHQEASKELLQLYRRGNRRVDFLRTRTALLGQSVANAHEWAQTADYLDARRGTQAP